MFKQIETDCLTNPEERTRKESTPCEKMKQEVLSFMSGEKGMKKYPTETKLEAVRLFYEAGKIHAAIANLLGLAHKERVEVWVRQYRDEG